MGDFACTYVLYHKVCLLSSKARRGQQVSWHWSYRRLAAIWVLRINLGPLEEQRVFLSISPALSSLGYFLRSQNRVGRRL